MTGAEPTLTTFHWEDADGLLLAHPDLVYDAEQGTFSGRDPDGQSIVLRPPLMLPVPAGTRTAVDLTRRGSFDPGRHLVLLIQAGAVAMGLFEFGEPVQTKSDKKYVVRGKGRAQPTHLASKGKSRYGSRLRLQNARALLEQTNQRIQDWHESLGPIDQIFYNCPVRLWSDLLRTDPIPPFAAADAIRIPLDLAVPTTEVLLRCYKRMSFGRLETLPAPD